MNIKNIYSSDELFEKKLTDSEADMAHISTPLVLVFNGHIEKGRFFKSLTAIANDFKPLFCKIHKREDGLYLCSASTGSSNEKTDSFFKCEHGERKNECLAENYDPSIFLPKRVSEKTKNPLLANANINGLEFCSFKLTELKTHFVIGCYINHSLFDLASILYLIESLADFYTNNKLTIKKSVFLSRDSLIKEEFKHYRDLIAATPLDFSFSNKKTSIYSQVYNIQLNFDLEKINEVKQKYGGAISTNDIIHAILLHNLATNKPQIDPKLFFTINMRNHLDLGAEVVGEFSAFGTVSCTSNQDKPKSLQDLIYISRLASSSINKEKLLARCKWLLQKGKFSDHPLPSSDIFKSKRNCLVTNGSKIPYEAIRFDHSQLAAVIPPPLNLTLGSVAQIYSARIGLKKKIYMQLSTPHGQLINAIKEYGNESGIFSVNHVPNQNRKYRRIKLYLGLTCYIFYRIKSSLFMKQRFPDL